MKAKLLFILLAIVAGLGIVHAETYSGQLCGNLSWSFNNDTGTLSIEGDGSMECHEWATGWPWDQYKSNITRISLPQGLTNIYPEAFSGCAIDNIVIPTSVTGILHDAFAGCPNLKSVTIPENVTFIGSYAFTCDTIVIQATTPPECEGIYPKVIIVPCSSIQLYQNHNVWGQYELNPLPYTIEISENVEFLKSANFCDNTAILKAADMIVPPCAYCPEVGVQKFQSWSDGNTDNPRTVTITQDTSFTANYTTYYYIGFETSYSAWNDHGGTIQIADTIAQSGYYPAGELTLTAVPDTKKEIFERWYLRDQNWNTIEGSTVNPLTIMVSGDKLYTYIAHFSTLLNKVNLDIKGHGSVNILEGLYEVDGEYYLPLSGHVTIVATPDEGYERSVKINGACMGIAGCRLSEITYNGDTISFDVLTTYGQEMYQDINLQISFTKYYALSLITNNTRGHIDLYIDLEDGEEYYDNRFPEGLAIELTAIPNEGYYFIQWSDSVKEVSRNVILTQDTTFTAEFGILLSGTCGENEILNWTLDTISHALTISGSGALKENYHYATAEIGTLNIGDGITSIGDDAFYYSHNMKSATIGNGVTTIGEYAFTYCSLENIILGSSLKVIERGAFSDNYLYNEDLNWVYDNNGNAVNSIKTITCYSMRPPTVVYQVGGYDNSFSESMPYSTIIYVPKDYLNTYMVHDFWGLYDVRPIGAEDAVKIVGSDKAIVVYKMVRDGHILIKKNDKTYTITGAEVK